MDGDNRPNEAYIKFISFVKCFVGFHATTDGSEWSHDGITGRVNYQSKNYINIKPDETEVFYYSDDWKYGGYKNLNVRPQVNLFYMLEDDCWTVIDNMPGTNRAAYEAKWTLRSFKDVKFWRENGSCQFKSEDYSHKDSTGGNSIITPYSGVGNIYRNVNINGDNIRESK